MTIKKDVKGKHNNPLEPVYQLRLRYDWDVKILIF